MTAQQTDPDKGNPVARRARNARGLTQAAQPPKEKTMLHHGPRIAGLLAIVAALVLAPSALAGNSAPRATKQEQRAYGKHCKTKKGRSSERTQCLKAMAKLDKGKTSSPSKACTALSKRKARGERKSAYARCVSEGAKLLKAKRRSGSAGSQGENPDEAYGDGPGVPEGDEGEAPEPIDESPGIEELDDSPEGDDVPLDDVDA